MSRKNGGIIGPANTPVGGLMSGVASGVWRMNDLLDFVGNSQWPSTPKDIENSTRFDDGSSDYLSRTPGSAGNRKTFTFSGWVKRGVLGDKIIFAAGSDSNVNGYVAIYFSGEAIRVRIYESSSKDVVTSALFRDTAAWYHLVVAVDTTQSTDSNRVKIYVNGSEADKASGSYASQDFETSVNNTVIQQVGVGRDSSANLSNYFDGYMAEVVLIDGQALDATPFGEFDSTTGIWKPRKIGAQFGSGGAGTNGFYLDFKDSSNLGNDASGLNNDFTVNNLTSIDQSTDTCVENFATLNPLGVTAQTPTFSEGNTKFTISSTNTFNLASSTFAVSSGKWYSEFKYTAGDYFRTGILVTSKLNEFPSGSIYPGRSAKGWDYYSDNGTYANNGSSTSYGNSYSTGDIIGVAVDLENNYLYFSKNGTFQNSGDPTSGSTGTGGINISSISGEFIYICGAIYDVSSGGNCQVNFGNPSFSISSGNADANGFGNFEYSVPSGYYALNTSNLNTYG